MKLKDFPTGSIFYFNGSKLCKVTMIISKFTPALERQKDYIPVFNFGLATVFPMNPETEINID